MRASCSFWVTGQCLPAAAGRAHAGLVEDAAHRRSLVREGLTSALYVALVLLATLVVVPQERLPSDLHLVQLMLGAGIGLLVAHWFAFRLATRLTSEQGAWTRTDAEEAAVMLLGGLAPGVVAAVPFLLLDGRPALVTALLLLAAFPAIAGGLVARLQGRSWLVSVLSGATVLLLAAGVVVLKAALSH